MKAILVEAAGLARNEAHDELEQILNTDDLLTAETGETDFSSSNLHIALLGTPAATGRWQLYLMRWRFNLGSTETWANAARYN